MTPVPHAPSMDLLVALLGRLDGKDMPYPTCCLEDDGAIGLDFSTASDNTLSFNIEAAYIGWSALIGDFSGYGRITPPNWAEFDDVCNRFMDRMER